MRVQALFPIDFARADTVGLREKAIGLVEAGREAGYEIDLVALNGTRLLHWRCSAPEINWPTPTGMGGLKSAWASYHQFWRKLESVEASNYPVVWWRTHPPSRAQLRFLARARKAGCTLVADVPTYPTVYEQVGVRGLVMRVLERRQQEVLSQASVILTSSAHNQIAGRPTIEVSNGVSCSAITLALPRKQGKFRVVGIGQWTEAHGVDRIFHALSAANRQDHWTFVLAGEGPAKVELQRLAKACQVDVKWRSSVWGNARAALLDDADAGLGNLGIHRKQVQRDRSLKHRMYAAAGLPILLTQADQEAAELPLAIAFPEGEASIDIAAVEQRLTAFRQNALLRREDQRKYAAAFDWSEAYSNFWQYLEDIKPRD